MARQPDVQYVQMYNYGSTARKLAPQPRYRKEQYQLPTQQPRRQQAKQVVLEPLSACAVCVACVMLVALLIGMFRIGELTGRRQELEQYIDVLQEQRADLQKNYESAYDLAQVEQRARQMGLCYGNEVFHVQMDAADPVEEEAPGFGQRVADLFAELFAKATR